MDDLTETMANKNGARRKNTNACIRDRRLFITRRDRVGPVAISIIEEEEVEEDADGGEGEGEGEGEGDDSLTDDGVIEKEW